MKIAIGSKNKAKVAALASALERLQFPAEVISGEVEHGTSPQPRSVDEAIEGARSRAYLARDAYAADIGVGIEGGTHERQQGMFLTIWAVAVDREGYEGIGCGTEIMLPKYIAQQVRTGREMGIVVDEYFSLQDHNQKGGLMGILTNNGNTRADASCTAVMNAFAPLLHPEHYR